MIPLNAKGIGHAITEAIIAPVTDQREDDPEKIFIWNGSSRLPDRMATRCVLTTAAELTDAPRPSVIRMNRLDHLCPGDVVVVHPNGLVSTLFRVASPHNSLFITDRCNSNCLMCSQPPRNRDDLDELYQINRRLIPWIPKQTQELGITGGEPTLLGKRLPALIAQLKEQLPTTALHLLTNGRAFSWPKVAQAFAAVDHPDLVFGVPLYSDYSAQHDYIVQAKDAFTQTVIGLQNMARAGLCLEIRVVLHRQSAGRLFKLAQFIYKNAPFVSHVAFMGLEYTGYTPHNDALLYMEPHAYMPQLTQALNYLDDMGICVSIYNLPLCLVPQELHDFCRRSISDWKQGYLAECTSCALLEQCGGIFQTSKKISSQIHAF